MQRQDDETFSTVLSNVRAYGNVEARFTILNDDQPPAGNPVPEPESGALAGGALLARSMQRRKPLPAPE